MVSEYCSDLRCDMPPFSDNALIKIFLSTVSLLINQRLYLSVVFSSETDLDVRGLNSQAFLLQRIPGIKNELGADNSFWALVEVEAPGE